LLKRKQRRTGSDLNWSGESLAKQQYCDYSDLPENDGMAAVGENAVLGRAH